MTEDGQPFASHVGGRAVVRRLLAAPLLLAATAALVSCLPPSADSASSGAAVLPAATAVSADAVDVRRYQQEIFSSVGVEKDIQYGTAPDLQDQHATALKLDMYSPADDLSALRPAIIWVHGGGFAKGDKGDTLPVHMATRFAKMGYVAVSINYRLLDGPGCNAAAGVAPACFNAGVEAVRDGQSAVRWLRAHADEFAIDPARIAIAGESAGGIVATGVGLSSDLAIAGSNPGFSSAVGAWISVSGGLPGGIFADSTDPAGLLFAGTNDNIVPYQWSVETADAMQLAGARAVFKPLQGAGHVPWAEYGDLFERESSTFLYDHLDLAGTAR